MHTPSAAPVRVESPAIESGAARVVLFLCGNGARPGVPPNAIARQRPQPLPVKWSFPAEEIVVPCTGKLQPEHFLKAFEAGADMVCVIACEDANCHYLEGSKRVHRRFDYVRGMLNELGLGGERLQLFHLPGSAKEDMALGSGCAQPNGAPLKEKIAARLAEISAEIATKLSVLGSSPLREKSPSA
jgi:coenzyme F420-reducing hydrogenase delta subunit